MMTTDANPIKIGLALGGGGARGLAHIGVLRVLEREGIPVHLLAGTSMGGLIAAAYASPHTLAEIEAELIRAPQPGQVMRFLDRRPTRQALLKGERLRAYFAQMLGPDLTFADLRLPTALLAVDVRTGREVVLRGGRVVDAMRATMSVPGVFAPVEMGGYRLVDGGILNNVPTDVVREMGADVVIAVDVLPTAGEVMPDAGTFETMEIPLLPHVAQEIWQVEMIMLAALTQFRLAQSPPDVLLRPKIPPSVSLFIGFSRAAELFALGETAAVAALPQIHAAVAQATARAAA